MSKFWGIYLGRVFVLLALFPLGAFAEEGSDASKLQGERYQKFLKLLNSEQGDKLLNSMEEKKEDQAGSESDVLKLLKEIQIHGFLDVYYSYNFNRPENRTSAGGGGETNRFRAFDLEDNSVTVDNFELQISKPSTPDSRAGFALYTNYGEIAQRIVFDKPGNVGRADDDDFTVSVGYVSYLADVGEGLTLQAGRIPTWIGAEVWESIGNPNWSRSYLYQNAIPFTHTGVAAKYTLAEKYQIAAFLVNGWDSFEDNNNYKSAGYQLGYCDKRVSFYINGIHGNEKDDNNRADGDSHTLNDTRHLVDFILDLKPVDGLRINLNSDFGSEDNTGHWHGHAVIVAYDITSWFNLALRGEYLSDSGAKNDDGVFQTRTGVQQKKVELYEGTITANFKISDRILLRPEYRRDWSEDKVFNQNTKKHQDTVALSASYIF